MSYNSPHKAFVFEAYGYDAKSSTAYFEFSFDGERRFRETVQFAGASTVGEHSEVLDRALRLAFYVVGTSYYKTFPTSRILFNVAEPDEWQAGFLTHVYREGLSQFLFENQLDPAELAQFQGLAAPRAAVSYSGKNAVVLQSGGKDSLLLAVLLHEKAKVFTPLYMSSSDRYPRVLDSLGAPLRTIRRTLDITALQRAADEGGLNGHVPVTYIVESYALIDAILHGNTQVLAAIGHEGEEAHEYVGDLAVNHQWSKTWQAEQLLSEYVASRISPSLQIGSPLRAMSELKVAELFAAHAWEQFGSTFSSCNRANYHQGVDNRELSWCGECPKCANSYLLFAPFVEPARLQTLFNGQDLFAKPSLEQDFKGLLGVDGVMKPFECVGERDELRLAYHMARQKYPQYQLPFEVPGSSFDYQKLHRAQPWAYELIA